MNKKAGLQLKIRLNVNRRSRHVNIKKEASL